MAELQYEKFPWVGENQSPKFLLGSKFQMDCEKTIVDEALVPQVVAFGL